MRRFLLLAVLAVAPLTLDACASRQCDFHSQCGAGHYCSFGRCDQDCRMDFDCAGGEYCSEIGQCVAGTRPDGGPTPMNDAGPPPMLDAGPMTGTGRYLDRCTSGSDCASGLCEGDVGGTSFCTITCSGHRDCASEHVCGSDGRCHYDDTGISCTTGSAASCELGLCIGNSTTGRGHCTRECTNASDCPAGYACAAAGSTRVCVDIEKPCSGPDSCETGLCLSVQGCTAECRSAADCPRRITGFPPYTCAIAFGSTSPICVPPTDIIGADPIGASCPATGTVACRSDACDTAAPLGPMCTQSCTQEGGCGPGLGCYPSVDGSTIELYCSRAGTRSLGQSCGSGRECDSGLCDTSGYCTRLCTDDGLCPTDMRCTPVAGFSISLCRR
ncbi:MAG: hypothetical protein R3B82_04040 [Sandaracinaceae bacterium]